MRETEFTFVIEMFRQSDAVSLGQFRVEVDWEPAREHLRLMGLRLCKNGTDENPGGISIEPVWAGDDGEPHAIGARLTAGDLVSEVAIEYFKPLAVELSSALVEKKELKHGELFRFKLLAYRREAEPRAGGLQFTVRDATPPLHFVDSPLAELREKSAASGEPENGDVPVFIPQGVLDEIETLTREAASLETGGILIGQMHRDAAIPEIAVVITAQIPAHFTESKTTSLTFTAETWTAVQAALDLRKSGEMMLGWWHSHPSFAFCKAECPPERRRECALQKPFLSSPDLHLHRAVFAKACHVALLANNADAGLGFALFGWCGGAIQRRAFRILGATPGALTHELSFSKETSTEDHAHATPCKN